MTPDPTQEMLAAVDDDSVVLRFDGSMLRKKTGLVVPEVLTDEFSKSTLVKGIQYSCTLSRFVPKAKGEWVALVNYTGAKVTTMPPHQDQLFEIQVGTDPFEGQLFMTAHSFRQVITVEKAMEISRMFETAAREHIQWRLKR